MVVMVVIPGRFALVIMWIQSVGIDIHVPVNQRRVFYRNQSIEISSTCMIRGLGSWVICESSAYFCRFYLSVRIVHDVLSWAFMLLEISLGVEGSCKVHVYGQVNGESVIVCVSDIQHLISQ